MKKRSNFYTRHYFFGLSLTVLIIGLIAFSDNFLFDVGQESNSNPGYVIHGLLMYAWLGVTVVQTNHIRKLNTKAHIRLGITGFVIALLMILSITYLNTIGQSYSELPFFGKANRIFFPVFAMMILLAYLKRDKPELHKHLIMVGILLMMEPMLSRVGMNTGTDAMVVAPLLWLLLWISLIVYDIIRLRKIHFLTYSGLIFCILVYKLVM